VYVSNPSTLKLQIAPSTAIYILLDFVVLNQYEIPDPAFAVKFDQWSSVVLIPDFVFSFNGSVLLELLSSFVTLFRNPMLQFGTSIY